MGISPLIIALQQIQRLGRAVFKIGIFVGFAVFGALGERWRKQTQKEQTIKNEKLRHNPLTVFKSIYRAGVAAFIRNSADFNITSGEKNRKKKFFLSHGTNSRANGYILSNTTLQHEC